MRLLRDSEILSLCDEGRGQHAWLKALLPVATVCGKPVEELLDWPLGLRNQQLLLLHIGLAGPSLDAVAQCTNERCQQSVEVSFPVSRLASLSPPSPDTEIQLDCGGRSLMVRPVRCRDLIPTANGNIRPTDVLLRCVRDVDNSAHGLPPLIDVLTDPHVSRILQQGLEDLDPLARIQFSMQCPVCNSEWLESLNVPDFFWTELQQVAAGILQDVHLLATSYAWTEEYILSLPPQRRDAYRQLITQTRPSSKLRFARFA